MASLSSVFLRTLKTGHDGNSYTTKPCKCYKLDFSSFPGELLSNIYQHIPESGLTSAPGIDHRGMVPLECVFLEAKDNRKQIDNRNSSAVHWVGGLLGVMVTP